jgi:hypothetical protein
MTNPLLDLAQAALDGTSAKLPSGENFVIERVNKNAGHPTWWLTIRDTRTGTDGVVELQTQDLLDQRTFQQIVLTRLDFLPLPLPEHRELDYVRFVDQVARLATLG